MAEAHQAESQDWRADSLAREATLQDQLVTLQQSSAELEQFTADLAPRERGGCLTSWLVFMFIGNSVVGLALLASGAVMLAGLSLVSIACAVALWRWQKWGFFGLVGLTVLTLVMNLAMGVPFLEALTGLGGIAILGALIRPKWQYFE